VTPIGGRVGDPFTGSGSTALACLKEGHGFEGCDIDPGAIAIAEARLAHWQEVLTLKQTELFGMAAE
jgi:DNA modification methylase